MTVTNPLGTQTLTVSPNNAWIGPPGTFEKSIEEAFTIKPQVRISKIKTGENCRAVRGLPALKPHREFD